MRIGLTLVILFAVALALYLSMDTEALARLAAEQQRAFQNQMAGAVRALRTGEPGALLALCAATAAYGFFHAVGPGHGKALIGGVGLGSSVSVVRLLSISVVSSLIQAGFAIVLVYGGFSLLNLTARSMTGLAEDYLAPASYLAIAAIGALLLRRGMRALIRERQLQATPPSALTHDPATCDCCNHGPSPEEVAGLTSMRDTIALIASIAIRPCTGAIFLLVIAWQMDLILAGALAVMVMGLGTASFTSLVAVSSIMARGVTLATSSRFGALTVVLPGLQVLAGTIILWLCLTLFYHTI